jgi:hypothetical protein
VVERKNRVVQAMAQVMLHNKNIPQRFWAEAVNTAVYIINCVYFHPGTKTTPYEIWTGVKPNIKYFKTFGSKCYIFRNREHLSKFDSGSDEGIFLGYSLTNKAYRVFHLKYSVVIESINMVVDDARTSDYFSDDDEGMTFSSSSVQVMDKETKNRAEPDYENEKKRK